MLPTRRRGLISRTVDGEVVILNRETDQVHRLNVTASYIWNLCDGTHMPDDIAARLAADFEKAADEVIEDVRGALANLRELGLLESSDSR
jgi:Coenzyme PQQ synthesis protein D (PqqD)